MEALQEDVLTIEDFNDFHNYQDKFEDFHDAAPDVFDSVVSGSNDITGHLKGLIRKDARKTKADELQQQTSVLKQKTSA